MAESAELQERIAVVNELFALPDAVVKINAMVRDPETNAGDIAAAISSEVAMSAKVLKLVNSSFYGFSRRVTSINYAVVILGFNTIRNLVMSVFMASQCKSAVPGFDTKEFWRYSINCAIATEHIARLAGYPQPEDAFMAGMMNKIGLVVMSQYWPDELAKVIAAAARHGALLLEAEKRMLGYDHYAIGAALLDRWNLPEAISDVCRHIAAPGGSSTPLCWAAHLANIMVRALCLGSPGDNAIPRLAPQTLARLGLKPEQLPTLLRQLLELSEKSKSFINMEGNA